MLECINQMCTDNKKGECTNSIISTKNIDCCHRKTKTPSYAEEQLENAIDKENRCYNSECAANDQKGKCTAKLTENYICETRQENPPKFINYEEEYKKLKAENETLSSKVTLLEQDNKEFQHANNGLAAESKERLQTIKKLQRVIEENSENVELRNQIEDLDSILTSTSNERDYLKKENEKLSNELSKANDINRKINEEFKNRNILLEERHKEDEERIQIQKATIIELKEAVNSLRCQYEEAVYYIEKKETEIKTLNKKLEDAELLGKMIKKLVEGI